jgi:hypothetical protein
MRVVKCIKLPDPAFIFDDCRTACELFTVGKLYPVIEVPLFSGGFYSITDYVITDLGDDHLFETGYLMLYFGDCFKVLEFENGEVLHDPPTT